MSARVAAVLALLLAQAQPQTPAPPAPAPIRITATVLSADGRPARDLQARDVELREDGVVQPILSVEPRAPGPRRIAVLLDEFHVSPGATTAVRAAIHWFVEEYLRDGDQVAIVKPLDSLQAIHFTADRARLHDAIEAFDGRNGIYTARTPLEADTVGQAPALAEAARAQIVLSALRVLTTRLGGMPGRPAVVLVSEGLAGEPHVAWARELPDGDMVQRFANRFDVPVFALSPAPQSENDPPAAFLRTLAAQTGAEFRATTDLTGALRAVAEALDGGYVITYRPPHPPDGRFHEIRVTTRRKDATVRARAGYVSAVPIDARLASRGRTPSVMSTRLLRRSALLKVWAGITRFIGPDGHVVITWEAARSSIGDRRRPARVMLKASKADGTVLFDGPLVAVRSGMAGTPDRAEFDAPSGRVEIDMTILGLQGEKLDTETRDLEVPSIGAGTLLLPPLVVPTRSAREFREVLDDEHAAPDPESEFSRTERLLIRVPAYAAINEPARVTARLLNRKGQQIQTLDQTPDTPGGVSQFDLSLAPLAPGEYILEFRATGPAGTTEQRVSVRITG